MTQLKFEGIPRNDDIHYRKFYDCQVRKCHLNYALLLMHCHFEIIL